MLRIGLLIVANALFPAPGRGALVCANCHPKETLRYLSSPMGASIGPATGAAGGHVTHPRSGSSIVIESRGGKMVQRLAEKGLTAEYEIGYQIGAGKLARSFIVENKGYLFESPASWFRAYGWDVSPGYALAPVIDFDRPITETCLFCHAGDAKFSGPDGRRVDSATVTAITCDRCHGASEEHVRQPSARNIVNPAKLTGRARDSVCEQCHLEGEARILNPGKSWRDFQAGANFEQTAAVYVWKRSGAGFTPVSQVEQLAESRCAIASGGALWCGACHRAHGDPPDLRQVCASCHATLSKAAHPDAARTGCAQCHMPRVSTGYTHVAVTDHRIRRRPTGGPAHSGEGTATLGAWVEPPQQARQRDRILANLTVGLKPGLKSFEQTGLELLAELPPSERGRDGAILAAECDAMLDRRALGEAVAVCRRAAEQSPASAGRAMGLGTALERAGDLAGAANALRKAIALDPSLKHAYAELWNMYDGQNQIREMRALADRFLEWNPRNVMFRVLKANLAADSGAARRP